MQRIRATGRINLLGEHDTAFDEPMQMLFMRTERLPHHSNGMRFSALGEGGAVLKDENFYSIGGGFITREGETEASAAVHASAPYPFESGDQLLELSREHGLELFELVLANERTWRSEADIRSGLLRIWNVMQACVERGFRQTACYLAC